MKLLCLVYKAISRKRYIKNDYTRQANKQKSKIYIKIIDAKSVGLSALCRGGQIFKEKERCIKSARRI